ncbi:SPOR domain-containing protein [Chitinispirillales bacterium ANBcel5]|uniref:SPOR domain-containing protein n=1 Tax=Cellulosispirillum alkaliphilum TaxID=3039283 RepID=UPI002A51B10C|nr:SPOR domain-containing protein [Chitinispirillales bacterium ANBcel5]
MITKFANKTVLLLLSLSLYVTGEPLTNGEHYLNAGEISKAQEIFKQVLGNDPLNAEARLLYARTLGAADALSLYDSLSSEQEVPARVRAEAFKLLADHAFSKGEWERAANLYQRSGKITPDFFTRHRWALSSALDGNTELAANIWHTLSLEHGEDVSKRALLHLAYLLIDENDYKQARQKLLKAGEVEADSPVKIAILAARLFCAKELGLDSEVESINKTLAQKNILEQGDLKFNRSLGAYTVQVGAFGDRENAIKIREKLNEDFEHVQIAEATVDNTTIYRVRAGLFSSPEEAQRFLDQSLKKAGFQGQVVRN